MDADWDFEVAVVGGGPGGSAAASALARRGHRVLVVEREQFPRFHIGESLLPWLNEVLSEIGAEEVVAAAGFVEKWGASFANAEGATELDIEFAQGWEVPCPQTYQVPRPEFDRILLEHAASCGAQVLQGRRATQADFDDTGVTLAHSGEDADEARVRVGAIIDASGRAGFLAKRFGERRKDPVLQSISVHRQFEGVPRCEGRRAGNIRVVNRPDHGWFWFIPITGTVVSVGVVLPRSAYAGYAAAAKPTPEEALAHFVAETSGAARLLADARPLGPAHFDADYSYLHSRHAGDRFVLVGDAGAFLDPIFSTGVLLAMQSGIEAAEVMSDGLRRGDLGVRRFTRYERRLIRRYRHFRRFVAGFYDAPFREVFFNRKPYLGIYAAVLSVLSGNWRPSLKTRVSLGLFFALVALQRIVPVVTRRSPDQAPTARP